MDPATLAQLEMIQQLLLLIIAFHTSRMMPIEVICTRPDGVCEVLVYHRDIPLMSDEFRETSIFHHQGVVSAVFRALPEPHFLVCGFLDAIHNALEAFYLVQVHARLGQAVLQFLRVAFHTPGPFPDTYRGMTCRTFTTDRPFQSTCTQSMPSATQSTLIQKPSIRPRPTPTLESLQQTLAKVQELARLQKLRRQASTVGSSPVRAPVPPTGSPTPTMDQLIEAARQQGLQELRIHADQFATDLLQSRPVASAAPLPSPSLSPSTASYHSSLEPSPEPHFEPVRHETPGSSPPTSSPASPTPSYTERMLPLTVRLQDQHRIVTAHTDSSDSLDEDSMDNIL
jgi:hypothetical protein